MKKLVKSYNLTNIYSACNKYTIIVHLFSVKQTLTMELVHSVILASIKFNKVASKKAKL